MHGSYRRLMFSVLVMFSAMVMLAVVPNSNGGPLVRLGYAEFDGEADGGPDVLPEYRAQVCPEADYAYYIVQFAGPITDKMKSGLESQGACLLDYIPDFSFVVRMAPKAASKLQTSTSLPIAWVGEYQPAFKLSSGLRQFVREGERVLQSNMPRLMIRFFPGQHTAESVSDLEQLASSSGAMVEVVESHRSAVQPWLVLSISAQDLGQLLPDLAAQRDVAWIDLYQVPRVLNDVARWVVQSDVENNCSVWSHDIHGEGQIIGVGDTGVDADSCFFYDGSQGLPTSTVNKWQRKIIAYIDYTGEAGWDEDGHGTHIAGTLAGDNYSHSGEYDTNDGIAYGAKLMVQDIGDKDSLSSIPFGLDGYFRQAYNAGARIHSNSWGKPSGSAGDNAYSYRSREVDDFMWKHPDFLIFFANGNDGPADSTVNPPATAKNCVSVGSCKNPHAPFSENDMASSSSHGPTADGRIKPTIVAPGEYLNSAQSDRNISSYNCGTVSMQGTSMACPVAAASAALARQYFTEGFYPTGNRNSADAFEPSASLLKAVLINGAVDMTGSDTGGAIPANGQGWGRINLDNVLYFSGDSQPLAVWDVSPGLQTGNYDEYTVSVSSADMLKVTLVWTDYPSSEAAQTNLVNDLDLLVAAPSGDQYRGNWFRYGLSVPGGDFDRRNVVECVYIRTPQEGDYNIKVQGYNIPEGPQPYSLVVVGGGQSGGARAPVLSGGTVSPFAGSISTTFTYTVHYQDPNETAPSVKNVVIDGTAHAMHLSSGTADDGDYEFSTLLGSGTHSYYFYFENAAALSARAPESGTFSGPRIGGANIAPVLSEGSVWPSAAAPGTTFVYTVYYNDGNADAPSEINVVIDDIPVPMELYDGAPYLGYYRFETHGLSIGTHTYYFYCNDGSGGDDRLPDQGTFTGPSVQEGNIPPALSDGKVSPASGTTDTTFVFSVTYFDGNGDAPAVGYVAVDGGQHILTLVSGSPFNGTYSYSTQLEQGSHTFYFYFEDPSGASARAPQDGTFSGPEVGAGNTKPVLTDGTVEPETGGTDTTFSYTVHYYDADGDQPVTGVVYVDNMPNQMSLAQGDPANGTYQFQTTLQQGSHNYYFYFYDGMGGEARAPETGTYTGPSAYSGKPFTVDISINSSTYSEGGRQLLWISCSNHGETASADVYVVLYCPNGVWLYYPTFSQTATPLLSSFEFPAGFSMAGYQLINVEMPAIQPGRYVWYAALTQPGTMTPLSNIATASWEFSSD